MSATANCACPCPTPEVVEIPGSAGADGAAGAAGADGVSVFTVTTADAVFADAVATVQVSVVNNVMFVIGQTVFGADPTGGTDHGTFEVISLTGTTVVGLRATDAPGDTALPFTIGSGGKITATGATGALAGALPASLTNSTFGTAGAILAAGVGLTTITVPLTSLATGLGVLAIDLLTDYVLGYAFRLISFDFVTTVAGTGAGASQVFNLEIDGVNVTNTLTVTLASTAAIGAVTLGSPGTIIAANVGTAGSALSIKMAAGGTVFTAGAGYFVIKLANLDTANAVASLNSSIDDLITALT